MHIVSFRPEDAEVVTDIIRRNLLEVNSADYGPVTIASMIAEFTPARLRELAFRRDVFVAKQGGRVVGTVSLEDGKVFTLFVDPSAHGQGVGTALMDYVERFACDRGYHQIELPSSLTAHAFYLKRGYADVRQSDSSEHGVNIIMRKSLS